MGTRLNPDGAKISALRIQRGWTQEQLAEIAGVSSRTIQRAETTDCAAFETVRAIACAFETGFDQLLKTGTRAKPAQEIMQPTPVPTLNPDALNMVERSARPVRRRPATFEIAAAALAAGILTGGIITYRLNKRVEPQFPAARFNAAAPAQASVGERVSQAGKAPGQASSVPGMVSSPVARSVAPDLKAEIVVKKPGDHIFGMHVEKIVRPAGLPPQTVITTLPQSACGDLPLPSRDRLTFVGVPEWPLTWSAHSTIPGSMTQNDTGGVVRQAMGQATKKSGEFVGRVSASIKRAF